MITSIERHHGLSHCFLQTLTIFRDRVLETEEAFSGTPRLMYTRDRTGMVIHSLHRFWI